MSPVDMLPTSVRRAVRRNGRRALVETVLAGRRLRSDRPLPDYAIIGAQRCGTTSLFRALTRHPAIMSNALGAKGVHYFDTDYQRSSAWFRAHFPTADERRKHEAKVGQPAVVGEASPYYMFHPTAMERMRAEVPDARLIVLLRDPVKRAISHHQHMVWEGHEPVEDLDEALDLEASRLAGLTERLAADASYRSRDHQHFSYVARGHYADQLERLFKHYPRDQILIMATEHLTSDPAVHLDRIQRFIGLEPDASINLGKRNASEKFVPRPETLERLSSEFAESNRRLRDLVDLDVQWT